MAGFAQYNHKMMHVRRDEMTVTHRKAAGVKYLYYHPVFEMTDKGKRARTARLSDQLSLGERVT